MAPDGDYHERIEGEVERAYTLAERARERGGDPSTSVEIPIATDMADRVENLLGFDGLAASIRELEVDHSRERTALELAKAFATGELGEFTEDDARIEAAVRTAVALLTEGVVAAPIEGIDRVAIEQNGDGSQFVRIWYAGPIRSAGGTAQALSVLVADYTRSLLGIDAYRPTDDEVGRTLAEIQLYEREVGLQYTPNDDEVTLIARQCPVMLDGEPTTDDEVEAHRGLDRIDTDRGRGGMCLVLAEGIAQKANKLARYVDEIDEVDWPWLATLRGEDTEDEPSAPTPTGIEPDAGYLKDLIAGRPVVGHPSEPGGFRLRYGRARNHGLATAGVHPATMRILDDFLAPGTQLKTERPGKAAGVIPVDTIDGPTVRMADGSVRQFDDPDETRELRTGVSEIIDLGEYLVNVGEFVENNHVLLPGAFDQARWEMEMAEAGADLQAARDANDVSIHAPSADRAITWATTHDAPIHPRYTYPFHDLTRDDLEVIVAALDAGTVTDDGLTLPDPDGTVTERLGWLLIEHAIEDGTVMIPEWRALAASLGYDDELARDWSALEGDDALDIVNAIAPFTVRPRAPTRIGARMGRPEKSQARSMSPPVHALFPVGAAGGDRRSVEAAAAYSPTHGAPSGEIDIEINRRGCTDCGSITYRARCPSCQARTEPVYTCPTCEHNVAPDDTGRRICPKCDRSASCTELRTIDIEREFAEALDAVDRPRRHIELLKGVKGLTSATKTPEPLEKGVLRALHDVTVFKDGTIRYDMTDVPVTAIRPAEVGVDVETFRELGYSTDIDDEPLTYDDQVVELQSQDILLSYDAAEHLTKVAHFVDDLLTDYYGVESYYDVDNRDDLVGELVLGLAPHTSAAVVGRIVGFTDAAVGYAHPFFHAAKRRNCDGDEDCVMLLMDGLLNFSRSYLPSNRGGRMDAPLVLSTRIDPNEIDDESHNIETVDAYSLDLYRAADTYTDPSEVEIDLAKDAIDAGNPVSFRHTHDPSDIAAGPDLSAYKTLDSMEEKLTAQLELARRIRAVDEADVAERVIEGHYLPDLLGNLRAFSSQETRCRDCGKKYRRVPLTGSCLECGGTVSLTVYEGMVTKYLETAIDIAERYDVRPYTRQRLEVLDMTLSSLFEDDTDKQAGIADFM